MIFWFYESLINVCLFKIIKDLFFKLVFFFIVFYIFFGFFNVFLILGCFNVIRCCEFFFFIILKYRFLGFWNKMFCFWYGINVNEY